MLLHLDDTNLEACYLDHPYIQVKTSTYISISHKVLLSMFYILISHLFSDRSIVTVLSYRTVSSIDAFEASRDNYLEPVKANSN